MKLIPLSNSPLVTIVDDDDYERALQIKWRLNSHGYAVFGISCRLTLHGFIMKARTSKSLYIDHINGDTLDNRKRNLRFATNSQNQANRIRLSLNTSGYRGVTFHKRVGRWQAAIKRDGKSYYLGIYKTREEAALAYNVAALQHFGEYARLNQITEIGGKSA